MARKRALEHYRKHEIVAEAAPGEAKWTYTLSVLSHDGDKSTVVAKETVDGFESDLAALQAAKQRGRELIDKLASTAG